MNSIETMKALPYGRADIVNEVDNTSNTPLFENIANRQYNKKNGKFKRSGGREVWRGHGKCSNE